MITNQNIVSGGTSISGVDVSIASSVTSDSGLINMTGLSTGQMTSVTTGQTTVSLPYAIHINLTSSGQVKLPPQLQPITTSAAAATTTTKSSVLAPLQLPAQLLLTPTSTSILATQQIKSEPCTPKAMGKSNIKTLEPSVVSFRCHWPDFLVPEGSTLFSMEENMVHNPIMLWSVVYYSLCKACELTEK